MVEKYIYLIIARDHSIVEAWDDRNLADQRLDILKKKVGQYGDHTVDLWVIPINVPTSVYALGSANFRREF